ncbi:glycosyltransferase family 4 protein, partial [Candidatus Uhrbacteria bacterium]|nr:glycosyltransferase family 4 protein [Candidatus Uhrbacteria bacterium]
ESGTGIGRYTAELLRELAEMQNAECRMQNAPPPHAPPPKGGGETEFVVFLRKDGHEMFELPDERWTKVLADFRPYTIGVQTAFPRLIREADVDLMHFTHFDHPIRCPVPFVITIHDLILLEHPSVRATTLGPLRFWMKYAAYRRVLDHAVRRSVRILTPSRAVKEQIAERFGILREKIIVTPLGGEHAARDGNPKSEIRNPKQILNTKFKTSKPYVLYVGNAYPHKNLEQLIRILPKLIERHPQLQLMLVGREDDFYRRLKRTAARTPIVFTGALPEDELRTLLANAAAYVSPSLAEGFDLPTIEALALGTPVVASDIPVHREVLGDVFVPFPPNDDAALIEAIHRGLVHSELRATLVDRGIARAQQFSWRTCALLSFNAYREATACLDAVRTTAPRPGAQPAERSGDSPPRSSSQTSTRG